MRACESAPRAYLGPDATAQDCAATLVAPAETYYPREPLDLSTALRGHGVGLAMSAHHAGLVPDAALLELRPRLQRAVVGPGDPRGEVDRDDLLPRLDQRFPDGEEVARD